jgi:hypothetical protein
MAAGLERRPSYLVSHNYVTGNAKVWSFEKPYWHDQPGDNHASHLHLSFTVGAESSTAPLFVTGGAPPPQPLPPLPPGKTIDLGDIVPQITDKPIRLGPDGNGYFDLPAVSDPATWSGMVIGLPDPEVHGWGALVPTIDYTLAEDTKHGRVCVRRGTPGAVYTIRVLHG